MAPEGRAIDLEELTFDGRRGIYREDSLATLILASTSAYRRQLLTRLGLDFQVMAPRVDEARGSAETARQAATRLAQAKAQAVACRHPEALVIGSDQLAEVDGEVLGKPGSALKAVAQLARLAGHTVTFQTGLCLIAGAGARTQLDCVSYQVTIRPLTKAAIERYVARERPWDCAGSFKSEGLGIALFSRQQGDDPTALIGLPLIRLIDMLALEGVQIP